MQKRRHIIFPDIKDEIYDIAESIFLDEILPLISPITLSAANPFLLYIIID